MKHGMSRTAIYNLWSKMIDRCCNASSKHYPSYGGRGIVVCVRWREFENFFADMGKRPPGTSLDRIDNNGNYEPGNCRWATAAQQQNNRRNTIFLIVNGRKECLSYWVETTGLSAMTITSRIALGWTETEAVLTPSRARHGGKRPPPGGLAGVCRTGKKWGAKLSERGAIRWLGTFETPEAAHAAYVEARKARELEKKQ